MNIYNLTLKSSDVTNQRVHTQKSQDQYEFQFSRLKKRSSGIKVPHTRNSRKYPDLLKAIGINCPKIGNTICSTLGIRGRSCSVYKLQVSRLLDDENDDWLNDIVTVHWKPTSYSNTKKSKELAQNTIRDAIDLNQPFDTDVHSTLKQMCIERGHDYSEILSHYNRGNAFTKDVYASVKSQMSKK